MSTLTKLLVAATLVATVHGQAPTGADDCGPSAPMLVDGINPAPGASGVVYTNAGATSSPQSFCALFNGDVWFRYVASGTGVGLYTFSTCTPAGFTPGTLTDTVLGVYDACGGAQLACSNNSICGFRAEATNVALTGGQTYYVRVGDWNTPQPQEETFYVTVVPYTLPLADECAGARPIGMGVAEYFPPNAATTSAGVPTCGAVFNDVWFSFTASHTGAVTFDGTMSYYGISTPPSGGVIAVYDGCGGAELICRSVVTFDLFLFSMPVVAGNTYFGRMGSAQAGTYGDYTLTLWTTPTNDECSSGLVVSEGPVGAFSTVGATPSASTVSGCLYGPDLWFTFQPGCTGSYVVHTPCSAPTVEVYSSCGGSPLTCAAGNGDCSSPFDGGSTFATFFGVAGTAYRIRIGAPYVGIGYGFALTIGRASTLFQLSMSAPAGPGSFRAVISGGASSGSFILPVTLAPGAFPNGWLGGLDIPFADLAAQISFGPPFTGSLNACGSAVVGPILGLPNGLSVWATSVGLNPSGSVTGLAAASTFVVP